MTRCRGRTIHRVPTRGTVKDLLRRRVSSSALLDHLIRPLQQRLGDRQAEGLGGLEVDDQLELRGLLLDNPKTVSEAPPEEFCVTLVITHA